MRGSNLPVILIPTTGEPTLEPVLRAVLAQVPADHIYVLGFGEALAVARECGVQSIDFGRKTIKAVLVNTAVRQIKSNRFIIVDADVFPRPGWYESMIAGFDAGHEIFTAAIGINGGDFWTRVYNLSISHEFTPEKPPSVRTNLPGAALAFTRRFFDDNGPLSEDVVRSEDYEWILRAASRGVPLYFWPAAVVDHLPSSRSTFREVMRAWFNSGYDNWQVRLLYAKFLKTPWVLRSPWLILLLSPLLALKPALRIFFTSPKLWKDILLMFPFVYLTKLAWCWGVFAHSRKGGR